MSENFRTCVFGGFDKQDVAAFIEKQASVHREQVEALTAENAALKETIVSREAERDALAPKAAQAEQDRQTAAQLRQQLAELSERAEALQRENARLAGPAQEYENLKEHIADIEISAHRRTEEFRANAVSQLRALIAQQRDWCGQQRMRYQALNDAVLQRLHQAEETLQVPSDENFDGFMDSLQQLEDSLQ